MSLNQGALLPEAVAARLFINAFKEPRLISEDTILGISICTLDVLVLVPFSAGGSLVLDLRGRLTVGAFIVLPRAWGCSVLLLEDEEDEEEEDEPRLDGGGSVFFCSKN